MLASKSYEFVAVSSSGKYSKDSLLEHKAKLLVTKLPKHNINQSTNSNFLHKYKANDKTHSKR